MSINIKKKSGGKLWKQSLPPKIENLCKIDQRDAREFVPYKHDLSRAVVGVGVPDNPRFTANSRQNTYREKE